MISDLELEAKVQEAKNLSNCLVLACVAVASNSPTNAANIARDGVHSLGEQQYARWLRMAIERGLRTGSGLLKEFFDATNFKEGDTTMATMTVDQKSEKTRNGALGDPGASLGTLGFFGLLAGLVGFVVCAVVFAQDVVGDLQHEQTALFYGIVGLYVLSVFALILLGVYAARHSSGRPVSSLPNDEFRVIGAFQSSREENGIYVVVEGRMYRNDLDTGYLAQRTALLKQSAQLEIAGFPNRAIGPGEFRLKVEKRSERLVTHGKESSRTWHTYTFIPVEKSAEVPSA